MSTLKLDISELYIMCLWCINKLLNSFFRGNIYTNILESYLASVVNLYAIFFVDYINFSLSITLPISLLTGVHHALFYNYCIAELVCQCISVVKDSSSFLLYRFIPIKNLDILKFHVYSLSFDCKYRFCRNNIDII